MIIGTRVLYAEEVDYWDADILQISVYRGMKDNLESMRRCAAACREAGTRYVVHPVRYSLLEEENHDDLMEMAELADLAMIIHDERTPGGERLGGKDAGRFRSALTELQSLTHVSIENAADTGDVKWFWDEFAESVTLDIGHVESYGLNSLDFVKGIDKATIRKLRFVHIHKNNGLRGGITDHWPLTPGCRELKALKELASIKSDISVILEINEIEQITDSIKLLKELRDGLDVNG